ncbi:hypothetical protein IV203_014009 [Nitzschia inconspicua]|uniref:Uncharacterized protein n=1 Tax=Nitzschia inconspicua TaxID=303405 RepID=A0A9K3M696_9STRA|nr:hypothetical protein IV203_014209 [Nitzschia inconspicua]KAG7374914.1 hypothetical protein IV203_014009 [Nitzschia inconspicua]
MFPNKRAKTTKEAAKKAAPVGKIEFEAGFFILKEIQRVIAFRAYESVVTMGDSFSQKQLEQMAFEKYHGIGGDSIGLAEKFMKGIEMFEGIYEDAVNDMTGQNERVLKFLLHCKEGKKIISNQDPRFKGINIASLTCKKLTDRSLVTGRTIIDMGKEVEASGRKIQAFVSKSTKYKDPHNKVSGEHINSWKIGK